MKKKLLTFGFSMLCICVCTAQNVSNDKSSEELYNELQQKQTQVEKKVNNLAKTTRVLAVEIRSLSAENTSLRAIADSLSNECDLLRVQQVANKDTITAKLNEESVATKSTIASRTLWGGVIIILLIIILAILAFYLWKRISNSTISIDEVRKAQTKLQEESLNLDKKLLDLMERQVSSQLAPAETPSAENIDHSLALKVADEIVRIEANLSRMDPSIKGHKQLSKAVQRIKDNFSANEYEIVDMLGKPYNEGMRVVANFVPDESLKEGEQIITGITKPQVNYKGKMIQSAQITVSQNI